jgi:hypothetical protein
VGRRQCACGQTPMHLWADGNAPVGRRKCACGQTEMRLWADANAPVGISIGWDPAEDAGVAHAMHPVMPWAPGTGPTVTRLGDPSRWPIRNPPPDLTPHLQIDACIDVMKLLCFEMMDMLKGAGGRADPRSCEVRQILRSCRRRRSLDATPSREPPPLLTGLICTDSPGRLPHPACPQTQAKAACRALAWCGSC